MPLLAGASYEEQPGGTRLSVAPVMRGLAWVRALSINEIQLCAKVSEVDVVAVLAPPSDIRRAIDRSYRALAAVQRHVEAFMATEALVSGEFATEEYIDLGYMPPAHTDTDIYVYFAIGDVLHMGDTFFNGQYPFIDAGTGGRIDGMIAAAEA